MTVPYPERGSSPWDLPLKDYIDAGVTGAFLDPRVADLIESPLTETREAIDDIIAGSVPQIPPFVAPDTLMFNVRDHGAEGTSATDASPGIQSAVDAARDAGGGVVFFPPGVYRCEQPIHLPDFTDWEDPWSINRSIVLLGASKWAVRVYLDGSALDTARYLIGHPSVGGTGAGNPRGQNSFQVVTRMTLLGPGYSLNDGNAAMGFDVPVLAISNVYKGDFSELHVEGCPAGPAIWNYSDNTNGSQGNRFRGITTFKGHWEIVDGEKVFSMEEVRRRSVRYLLHNDGPVNSVGRANDNILTDSHVYDPLIGVVDTRGHVNPLGGSNVGGCDNLRVTDNFFAARSTYELEEGTLTSGTSPTQVTLRTTAGTFDPANDFTDCVLRVLNTTTGRWESAWIEDFDQNTRLATVAGSGFTFTPTGATEYHVQYSDAQSRSDGWSPEVRPHAVLWACSDYQMRYADNRGEGITSMLASSGLPSEHGIVANYDVQLQFPYEIVNKNEYGRRTDGTPWRPRMWVAERPRGSTLAPANFAAKSFALSDPSDEGGASALVRYFTNVSAQPLVNGSIVSIRSTNRAEVSNSTTTAAPHVVAWNPAPPPNGWQVGERLTCALSGVVTVRVDTASAAVVSGDLIVPIAGRVGVPVNPDSATVGQYSRAVAKAISTAAQSSGTVSVWCKLI